MKLIPAYVAALVSLVPLSSSFSEEDVRAGHAHLAAAQPLSYTLVVEFRGLVDFVSDGSRVPGKAWVLLPNASDPATVPLPTGFQVVAHETRLLTDGVGAPSTAKPCGSNQNLTILSIEGYEVAIEGDVLQAGLVVDRGPLLGATPCDPSSPSCAGKPAVAVQQRSVNWIPKVDDLLPWNPPFRSGIFGSSPPPELSSRFILDKGSVMCGGLWGTTSPYYEVDFNVPPHRWTRRAICHSITVLMSVGAGGAEIVRTPFGAGTSIRSKLMVPSGSQVVQVIVENQPKGSETPSGVFECLGGKDDFVLHYTLREGSKSLTHVPKLDVVASPGPSADPQCSPADNDGP